MRSTIISIKVGIEKIVFLSEAELDLNLEPPMFFLCNFNQINSVFSSVKWGSYLLASHIYYKSLYTMLEVRDDGRSPW